MRLFVVRHGKAERDAPSGRDEDRALRPRGERQASWLGHMLAASDEPPEIILSSGLARALGTARLIQDRLGCRVQTERALETGHGCSEVLRLLAARTESSIAIVGHNPTLEELVGVLVRGLGARAALRTGECAELDVDPGHAAGSARLRRMLRLEEDEEDA